GDEPRERVLVEGRDRACTEVRQRADVEDRAATCELVHEPGVLDRVDAVPETVGAERLERSAHGCSAGHLSGVRDGAEPERPREREHVRVWLRRVLRLEPAEADADDAAVAIPCGPLHRRTRLLLREASWAVGREAHLDAVQLACLLRAVAHAFVCDLPRDAAADTLRRTEDALEVDRAVRRRFGRI